MAIHQPGRDPAAPAIDPLGCVGVRWKIRKSAGKGDATVARSNQAALDHAEIGQIPSQGGNPGVVPDTIKALGHTYPSMPVA